MFQGMLTYFLFGVAFVAMGCFLLLVFWYLRNERRERFRLAQTKADIADITILFQAIRDIINQQKELAREFNRDLERKMKLVKEVLARGVEKNEELYEKQRVLEGMVEAACAELESIQRQIGYLRKSAASTEAPATAAQDTSMQTTPQEMTAHPAVVSPPKQAPPAPIQPKAPASQTEDEHTDKGTAFMSVPKPPAPVRDSELEEESAATLENPAPVLVDDLELTGLTDAPFSEWVAPDLDDEVIAPRPEELLEEAPAIPEDPQAARNAFRALLDMDAAPAEHSMAAGDTTLETPSFPPDTSEDSGDNGSGGMAPLQRRVLEYSEAGMTVAEIARELGIGKGEVRLMLSLAKQRRL